LTTGNPDVTISQSRAEQSRAEQSRAEQKPILDATCGSRMIWFNKYCENAIYMDNREEHGSAIWKSTKNDSVRYLNVEPDVIGDFTYMPFADESFYLIVFDPPHIQKIGDTSWMRKKYGKLPKEWQPLIRDGFNECMRCLKPYGTLIFKWSEVDIPIRTIIDVVGHEPLFGNRSGKRAHTHWMVFMKIPEG